MTAMPKEIDLFYHRAKSIAAGVARERITGADVQRGLSLGQLFAAYRRHHLPTLRPYRQKYAKRYVAMFSAAWGPDLLVADVDQSRVDLYLQKRRSLRVLPPGSVRDEEGNLPRGGRKATPPRDGTLNSDFVWLNSVFNWARKRKEGGRRLLGDNPLHDVTGLSKLERGYFHPYRRLWANERKALPDVDVAHAAGWKDTRAMKLAYQKADPRNVLAAVEFGTEARA